MIVHNVKIKLSDIMLQTEIEKKIIMTAQKMSFLWRYSLVAIIVFANHPYTD